MITYDRRLGNYRGQNGKLVSRNTIRSLIVNEQQELNTQLQRLFRSYQGGRLGILELQQRSAELIRDRSIQLGLLAVGGKEQLKDSTYKNQIYGLIGREVRTSLEFLQRNIVAIANGSISPAMASFRFKQIAASSLITHYAVEKRARENEGFNFASRKLEPGAKHCKSCPRYSTDGIFVPIDQIITPGSLCDCGGFCKCKISYKKDFR